MTIALAAAAATPETRSFRVNSHIIFDLIKRQAGTLPKALSENVCNSLDAGAKNAWVEIDNKGFAIRDDGPGFTTREEILRVFEELGFEHNDKQREFGRFGIGRAQAWAWANAEWVSNGFKMAVDIEQRGLDYDLYEGLAPQPGLTITGRFYKKLLTSELLVFEKEFAELLRYAGINVFLNGKQINRDPLTEKWDHDTPDAWIRLKDNGALTVYNMGVLVRDYPSYHFGSGGIVVTKPGRNLALNMARNDILTMECSIWKRLRKFLQKRTDERVRTKTTRMSAGEIENIVKRLMAGEMSYDDARAVKVLTDIQGKALTLDTLARQVRWPDRAVTVAPEGSRIGEQAHRTKAAFVLHPDTLDRFGVETVVELQQALIGRFAKEQNQFGHPEWFIAVLKGATFTDDLAKAAGVINDGYEVIASKDWTPEEKVVLGALRLSCYKLGEMLESAGFISKETSFRKLEVGVSETALAWTNGRDKIVLERRLIEQARRGVTGFTNVVNVLVHELLHDSASTGTHAHDAEFHQRFHDFVTDPSCDTGRWVMRAFNAYVVGMRSENLPLRAALLADLSGIEDAAREADDEQMAA